MKTGWAVEGIEAFKARASAAIDQLRLDLREGVLDAARQGIEEARRNHPYKDRTGVLSGYRAAKGGRATSAVQVNNSSEDNFMADMVWPAFYAGYVDKGTSTNRPYPFTPQAVAVATKALDENVQRATDKYIRSITVL